MRLKRTLAVLAAVVTGLVGTLAVPSPAMASGSVESRPGDVTVFLEVDGTGLNVLYIRVRASRHTRSNYQYQFRYWTQETNAYTAQQTAPQLAWYDLCTGYACGTSPSTGWIYFNRRLSRNQYLCSSIYTKRDGPWDSHNTERSPICLWVHS